MRISDWSSDVCSSDLGPPERTLPALQCARVSCPCRTKTFFSPISPLSLREQSGRHRPCRAGCRVDAWRSEEHTSELQSLMRISYAVLCLKKKNNKTTRYTHAGPTTPNHNHIYQITN